MVFPRKANICIDGNSLKRKLPLFGHNRQQASLPNTTMRDILVGKRRGAHQRNSWMDKCVFEWTVLSVPELLNKAIDSEEE